MKPSDPHEYARGHRDGYDRGWEAAAEFYRSRQRDPAYLMRLALELRERDELALQQQQQAMQQSDDDDAR